MRAIVYNDPFDVSVNNERKAKPSFIVSNHHCLDEAPRAYKAFCDREPVSKAIIKVA